jgi:hypothetical protein
LEKRDLLKLLGVDAPDFMDLLGETFRGNIEEQELQLGFLPETKRQQVKQILFKQGQREFTADIGQSELVGQETQASVRELLTPEEFKEYELRCSTEAMQLRGVLDTVGLTEHEFRSIFDLWRSLKALSPGTADYRDAQQSSETTIQQLLGPDRFQTYLWGVKLLGYSR